MHKLVSGSNMTSNSALNLMKLVDSPALTIKSGHEHVPYKPIYIYLLRSKDQLKHQPPFTPIYFKSKVDVTKHALIHIWAQYYKHSIN